MGSFVVGFEGGEGDGEFAVEDEEEEDEVHFGGWVVVEGGGRCGCSDSC